MNCKVVDQSHYSSERRAKLDSEYSHPWSTRGSWTSEAFKVLVTKTVGTYLYDNAQPVCYSNNMNDICEWGEGERERDIRYSIDQMKKSGIKTR